MVQTEQQYICIHQCLMAVLDGKENTGPPREVHDNIGYEGMIYFDTLFWCFGVKRSTCENSSKLSFSSNDGFVDGIWILYLLQKDYRI